MSEPADALRVLAAQLREEETPISPHVVEPAEEPVFGPLAAAGPRAAAAPAEYALVVEAVREGYLLHYGEPRLLAGHDPDLALLAGDYLYALGIERLAALGDSAAVRELADLISLCAQLHAEGRADAVPASGSLGGRGRRRAERGPRGGEAGAPGDLTRRESIDFALPKRAVADEADKMNGAEEAPQQQRAKPDPPGYFEGESMTRRRAFTIAAQGIGGIAGAAIVLPAVGFAVAPIFHRGKERWEAVGPVGDFVEDTYRQVVFTETEGIGDAGKTTAYIRKGSPSWARTRSRYRGLQPLRPPRLPGPLRRGRRQLHLPLPRRRLRLPGQADRRPAGAPARPFPDPHPQRPGRGRPPLQRHLPARTGPRPRPRRVHRRHLGIPLPAAPLHLPAATEPRRR